MTGRGGTGDGARMHRLRSGTAAFRTGLDGRVLEWNRQAERLTGIGAGEAEGRPCWEVIGGRDAHDGLVCHPRCSAARLAREGWPVRSFEVRSRTPQGPKQLLLSTIVVQGEETPLVLHTIHEPSSAGHSADGGPQLPLTPRQRQVLALLAGGVRAREIARRLGLSETTVRNHIQAILLALGVHSQLEAVACARDLAVADGEGSAA